MRATSFRRTVAPPVCARSVMLPNCSTVDSWPGTITVAVVAWSGASGRSPMLPADTCAFCAAMAALTSAGVRP